MKASSKSAAAIFMHVTAVLSSRNTWMTMSDSDCDELLFACSSEVGGASRSGRLVRATVRAA
eukprot:4069096-Pleurochrysis_carterae.AAC.1